MERSNGVQDAIDRSPETRAGLTAADVQADIFSTNTDRADARDGGPSEIHTTSTTKRARGRPKGSKNKKTLAGVTTQTSSRPASPSQEPRPVATTTNSVVGEAARHGPGRPRKEPEQMRVTVNILNGPAAAVPAVNPDKPLAAIFARPVSAATVAANTLAPNLTSTSDLQPSNPETYFLPQYDPSRPITNLDDVGVDGVGDDSSLTEDGVGVDSNDCFPLDRNDLEDETEPPPTGHRPPPPFVMREFAKVMKIIQSCQTGSGNTRSNCFYKKHNTFWVPHTDTFFILQNPNVTPEMLWATRWFFWDPLLLLDQIKCPRECRGHLVHHQSPRRPRSVVDWDERFWLIGGRYRCNTCRHTWQSWNSNVMAELPKQLADQFPAHLSRRSGVSKSVFAMMRCCFENGMGAKQVSDSINVLHRRRYDMLHVQYIRTIHAGKDRGKTFPAFPAFEERGEFGLHAYVPSAAWFRDAYDREISLHEKEYDQHTALLPCRGIAIDHSFKIAKQIAKIEGQRVFEALLTVTNEYGQIAICDLVPTKAHSQFDIALSRKQNSIVTYGLPPIRIAFTDNMADKPMLERHFPSLKDGIQPISAHSSLPKFEIPHNISVTVIRTSVQIQNLIFSLLDTISADEELVVGLDTEWNVDLDARRQGIHQPQQIAILQLVYAQNIWVIQINEMVSRHQFPMQLVSFLKNPRIIKVGKNIDYDLQQLQKAASSSELFLGGVDIAHVAKEKGVIRDARIGLQDLCAKVLHLNLEKDTSVRVSKEWEASVLTPEQLQYAATDVWASLEIFRALQAMVVPVPISFIPPPLPGTSVFIYQEDRTTLIAQGCIASEPYNSYDAINITSTRILIEFKSVYVPGAVLTVHHGRSLDSFGSPPFLGICKKNQLRTFVESFIPESSVANITEDVPTMTDAQLLQPVPSDEPPPDLDPALEPVNIGFSDPSSSSSSENNPETHSGGFDPFGVMECSRILSLLETEPWPKHCRSGVLKDIFHVFHMLHLTKNHGLVATFSRALRDAIFLPDAEDKSNIEAYLSRLPQKLTWDQCLRKKPSFIKRHCKHVIPPAEQLYPVVAKLFETYGPLKDAQTGAPLFNKHAWKIAENILKLIKSGFVSDPPNIPLYYCLGIVKMTGLRWYRCWRGTNFTEGGVHRPIRHSLPIGGVSPEHTSSRLKAFVFRHNMLVGVYNMTGQRYRGHFDLWLINELQELLNDPITQQLIPQSHPQAGWVNGNMYVQTTEVFGILPVPSNVQRSAAMLSYDAADPPKRHRYLASKQDTFFAVLTIHTDEERSLFSEMMYDDVTFASAAESSSWQLAAQKWNAKANGFTIFYKLVEHLQSYHTIWKGYLNARHTLLATANSRKEIDSLIHNPIRLSHMPAVKQYSSSSRPMPTAGLSEQPRITPRPPPRILPVQDSSRSSEKRKLADSSDISNGGPGKRQRSRRICSKCGMGEECKGNGGVAKCENACQDCGQVAGCNGRNSRNRNKKCSNANSPL